MMPWWVWLLILLIVLFLWVIWKYVLVPTVTVQTDKGEYDRTEIVQISGNVSQGGNPLEGKTAHIAIEPPTGDAYVLPDVVTDANGDYSLTWEIPDDAPGGTYSLMVMCLGVSASKTFRQIQRKVMRMSTIG